MKTLIVFASKHGFTEKCAKLLSEKISGEVVTINLKNKTSVDLNSFDKIVIGGSIYIGKIQKEVTEFCVNNLSILKQKKLGLFTCCMAKGEEAITQLNNVFPQDIINVAAAKEIFGGEFNMNSMGFFEKLIIKMVTRSDKNKPSRSTSEDSLFNSEERIKSLADSINNI